MTDPKLDLLFKKATGKLTLGNDRLGALERNGNFFIPGDDILVDGLPAHEYTEDDEVRGLYQTFLNTNTLGGNSENVMTAFEVRDVQGNPLPQLIFVRCVPLLHVNLSVGFQNYVLDHDHVRQILQDAGLPSTIRVLNTDGTTASERTFEDIHLSHVVNSYKDYVVQVHDGAGAFYDSLVKKTEYIVNGEYVNFLDSDVFDGNTPEETIYINGFFYIGAIGLGQFSQGPEIDLGGDIEIGGGLTVRQNALFDGDLELRGKLQVHGVGETTPINIDTKPINGRSFLDVDDGLRAKIIRVGNGDAQVLLEASNRDGDANTKLIVDGDVDTASLHVSGAGNKAALLTENVQNDAPFLVLYHDGAQTVRDTQIGAEALGLAQFVTQAADCLGNVLIYNTDGSDTAHKHAAIAFAANETDRSDGTPGTGKVGGRIGFWTENKDATAQQFRIQSTDNAGACLESRLVINGSDGYVGIGTETPTAALDVNGNTNVAGNAAVTGALSVGGDAAVTGALSVAGNAAVTGALSVGGIDGSPVMDISAITINTQPFLNVHWGLRARILRVGVGDAQVLVEASNRDDTTELIIHGGACVHDNLEVAKGLSVGGPLSVGGIDGSPVTNITTSTIDDHPFLNVNEGRGFRTTVLRVGNRNFSTLLERNDQSELVIHGATRINQNLAVTGALSVGGIDGSPVMDISALTIDDQPFLNVHWGFRARILRVGVGDAQVLVEASNRGGSPELVIHGSACVHDNLDVGGTLNLTGSLSTTNGDVQCNNLTCNNATIAGSLNATDSIFSQTSLVTDGLARCYSLDVRGDANITGSMDLQSASITGTLDVGGKVTADEVEFGNNQYFDHVMKLTTHFEEEFDNGRWERKYFGKLYINGFIQNGDDPITRTNSALVEVDGSINASHIYAEHQLSTDGDVVFRGETRLEGPVDVQNSASITGSLDVGGNLDVTGKAHFRGEVQIDGDLNGGNLNVGNVTADQDIRAEFVRANTEVNAYNVVARRNVVATFNVHGVDVVASGNVNAVDVVASGNVNAVDVNASGSVNIAGGNVRIATANAGDPAIILDNPNHTDHHTGFYVVKDNPFVDGNGSNEKPLLLISNLNNTTGAYEEIDVFVNGALRAKSYASYSNDITQPTNSDARFKTDITPLTDGMALLDQVSVQRYTALYGTTADVIRRGEIGFIADEIEVIEGLGDVAVQRTQQTYIDSSTLTEATANDFRVLDESMIMAVNVKATQELAAMVRALQAEVQDLRAEVASLRQT